MPREQGCPSCHFDVPPVLHSPALALDGLPAHIEPGATYHFTVHLRTPDLARAGFLIDALHDGRAAGTFAPADRRTEAQGATARSTRAGSSPTEPGIATWAITWRAPETVPNPVRFRLWANASDGNESRFGDQTHWREWTIANVPPRP